MNTTLKPSRKIAKKVIEIVDKGLSSGLGVQSPGEMCVEAAVCYAFGLPHGDNPPCVGQAVRDFKIRLNDCKWSSREARARGMRKLAIAQLGSNEIEQVEFGEKCFVKGTQTLFPFVFRKVADDKEIPESQKAEYRKHADICEKVTSLQEARKAVKSAYASAYASASASAYAYASAYASASASAYAYAYAYADAYAYASAYGWFKKNLGDDFLEKTADMALSVLIEMKSPGCKWLDLCE